MASVIDLIRSGLAPVRREGWPFVAGLIAAALLLGLLWQPFFWVGMILAAWCAYFFRDPKRVTPLDPALVVSPADGRIATIAIGVAPRDLGLGDEALRRISIFMSILDCHVNRAPVAGRITRVAYRPGKFFNAELDKASEDNERNGIVIESANGPIGVVQIAGLIARRIVRFAGEGQMLAQGERFGLIRFGSRLDVWLPATADLLCAEGQTAIAGETVLASFGRRGSEVRVRID